MKQRKAVTRGLWASSVFLLVAAVAVLTSCGDDGGLTGAEEDYCSAVHEGPSTGWGVIGPDGGVVVETDTSSQAYGVTVRVPAGAWDGCWDVLIYDYTTFSTPDYPEGFLPHHGDWWSGSFEILVYRDISPDSGYDAPDSLQLDMEISFPLNDAPAAGEIGVIYAYDEAAEMWRLVLPDSVQGSAMVLKTNAYSGRWSWGRVVLSEVDFDLYLAPLLEELHGTDEWQQLQIELENTYNSLIESDLAINCANLTLVQDLFSSVRSAAQADLEAFQANIGGACGVCDVLSGAFFAGYVEYVKLNVEAFLIKLFFIENGPTLLVQAYGMLKLMETWDDIASLACDYECYFGYADSEFYGQLASYYVAYAIIEIIDYAKSEYGCGLAGAGNAATRLATRCPLQGRESS